MLAIDCGSGGDARVQERVAAVVKKAYPQVSIYKARKQFGWGAGMYGLLCDTIKWAKQNFQFKHFLTLDYDALFIGEGPDARMLQDVGIDNAGLIASNNGPSNHWRTTFRRKQKKIEAITGGRRVDPALWKPGDSVLGSMMLLTAPCLAAMEKQGLFAGAYRNVRSSVNISDDAWLRFLVGLAGFRTINNREYAYNYWSKPEHYETVLQDKPDYLLWHPTKMASGGRPINEMVEKTCRNWFRKRRGKKPIK